MWTITLRKGIKFHNGEMLDANAVKLNLDAHRTSQLGSFVYGTNITNVSVTDPLTVTLTTRVPWPALPAYLNSYGRLGIAAPAQLNDKSTCPRNLIGTGPFTFKEWVVNDHLTVVRNPDYWRPDLPYLDEIEFRPVVESSVRLNAVRAGQLTIAHDFDPGDIVFARREAKSGRIDLFESYRAPELSYVMLNVTKSPFDDVRARRALAHAVNRDELNNILSQGILRVADGPFDKGVMSHVDDSGFPGHDLKRARELVEEYEAEKGPLAFTLLGTPDPRVVRLVELVQSQAREAGIDVQLQLFEQAQLISTALGGGFQATAWRNHGGTDPDYQYVWWRGGSPVNFGRFDDPEINRILDAGRSATNPAEREALYQGLSRRFGEQVYDVWITYLLWGILSRPEVRGIGGPELPTGGRANIQGAGHPTIGLWVDK